MNKINVLRLTHFFVINEGKKKAFVIAQTLHRDLKKFKFEMDASLTNVEKKPKFKKWIEEAERKELVPKGFFKGKMVIVKDEYHPFNPEKKELATELVKEKILVIKKDCEEVLFQNLSKFVELRIEFKSKSGRRVGEVVHQLVQLDIKPDNYDFMKLLILEKVRDKQIALPQLQKAAVTYECTLRAEWCPDSRNNFGINISREELELAESGVIEGNIV